MTGVNLKTGKPVQIKPRYRTGTDHAEFYCVWKGRHFRLTSLSHHLKKKVPQTHFLLVDSSYENHLAPKNEVAISTRVW